MAEAMQIAVPHRKLKTRQAPNVLIRMLALFDPSIRTVAPVLGRREEVSSERAQEMLGIAFRDVRRSLADTARWLDANGA